MELNEHKSSIVDTGLISGGHTLWRWSDDLHLISMQQAYGFHFEAIDFAGHVIDIRGYSNAIDCTE